jgi:hypothetical protein
LLISRSWCRSGHRQPEEVAILVAFRASDEAAFMWGSLADFTGAQAIALISQRPLSVAKLSSVLKTVRLLLAPTATSSVVALSDIGGYALKNRMK